jgi:asparagine synthase (glutamine-hydrolysing)
MLKKLDSSLKDLDEDNNIVLNDPIVGNSILSLRYNPHQHTELSKLNWKDFTPSSNPVSTNFLEKMLQKSIEKKITNSNDNLVMALSGGIDSTMVLSLIKKTLPNQNIKALSIQFADSVDETKTAKKIADELDVPHKTIFLENFFKELPKAISIVKQPFWDIHWYYLAKNTNSDWIVSGDGGDELFGGYTFRYSKFLSLTNSKSTPREKVKAYLQCHERDHVLDQEDIFSKRSNFSWDLIYKIIEPYFSNSLSPLEQVFLADYNGKLLYNFSPIANNINNHFNLKSLRPILDSNLIKTATHIPSAQKYNFESNMGKIPLRKILINLKKDHLIGKEKLGFSVNPTNLWISYGFELCENYLNNSRLVSDNWINPIWIKKHLKKDLSDIRYINKFFGLLAFEIWYRIFVTKEMNQNTQLS